MLVIVENSKKEAIEIDGKKIDDLIEDMMVNGETDQLALFYNVLSITDALQMPPNDRNYNNIKCYITYYSKKFFVEDYFIKCKADFEASISKDLPCKICGDKYAMPSAKHNGEHRCYLHD